MKIKICDKEYWWGGSVNLGHIMPFHSASKAFFDLNGGRENDQFAPLLLSSKGRYIWSESSFNATVENGEIRFEGGGDFEIGEGYENLRGAYHAAINKHFKFNGKIPDKLFWSAPQYNTWIELGTQQTTRGILDYANGIINHGLAPGILMIDEGWQEEYGVFEFNKRKIPNPKGLIKELHKLGFKVMLWVTPVVNSAGTNYKKLRDRGFLIKNKSGEVALRKWWNGISCVLDLTNPECSQWFHEQLHLLMTKYDVDGFKFDGGDKYFYEDDDVIFKPTAARDATSVYNEAGEQYTFNEFRAAWKFGGRGIVARLHDKYHTWNDFGLNTLIPHTIMQGLCGYAYCCPDMVGGGVLDCFSSGSQIDSELFVRWTQANALMGMMQLSIAPWRVLDDESLSLVLDAVRLHTDISSYLYRLAEEASETGEPIIRHMDYEYPGEGLETVSDQFMIGKTILAAPVLEKGAKVRKVRLPGGLWQYCDGEIFSGGGRIELPVNMKSIPFFIKKNV